MRGQQSARGNDRSRTQHRQILHHHADIAVLAQQFSHLAGQPFAEGAARIEKLHNRDIAARIAAHRVGRVTQKRCLMRADARGERRTPVHILGRLQRAQTLPQQAGVAAQRITQNGQDFGALRFREALGQSRPGQGCGEGGKQQASLHDYGFRRCVGT